MDKIQGSEVDPPLNDMGLKQADLSGDFLNKNFNIDIIYSSKYLRAKQTAVCVMNKINYNKKIIIDKIFL